MVAFCPGIVGVNSSTFMDLVLHLVVMKTGGVGFF